MLQTIMQKMKENGLFFHGFFKISQNRIVISSLRSWSFTLIGLRRRSSYRMLGFIRSRMSFR